MQLSHSIPSEVLLEYALCARSGARHCGKNIVSVLEGVFEYLILTFLNTSDA